MQIQLGPSEYVMEVSGTYNSNVVVMSLRVATNLRAYGPFGRAEGTSFTASGRVVGFFGRSGELLDSIGVYTA
uniref:Jacalin-type lectin domain-containing protein n=1 Tax=Oryza glumipatula TaxID=40148 RepID=A0A0E0BNV8_9ORYZ